MVINQELSDLINGVTDEATGPAPDFPEPLSETIQKKDCQNALQELKTLVEDQTEKVLGPLGFDMQVVQKSIMEGKTGGLWDAMVVGPLGVANDAIAETFNFDPAAIASGQVSVSNALTTLIDADGIQAALLAKPPPTTAEGDTVAAIDQKTNPLTEKQKNGISPCSKNVLIATVSTVVHVVTGAANEVLKKVSAAQSLLSMGTSLLDNFADGLFMLVGAELDKVFNLEVKLLDEITKVLNKTHDLVAKMGDEPFGFDHRKVIQDARLRLLAAAELVDQTQARLVNHAGFDGQSYDAAQAIIEATEDILSEAADEFDLGFSSKPYKLLGYLLTLEGLWVLWLRQAVKGEVTSKGLLNFPDSLQENLQVDNFFAPILDLVRCRLLNTVTDMADVERRGQLFLYIAKEYRWVIELKVLSEVMRASRSMLSTVDDAVQFSNEIVDWLDTYANQTNTVTMTSAEVDAAIQAAVPQIRNKVQNQATPASVVLSYVDRARQKTKLRSQQIAAQKPMLLDMLGIGDSSIVQGLAYAKQYTEYLTGKGLGSVLGALKEGDFSKVFGADALTAEIESMTQVYVNRVRGCVDTTDPAVDEKLQKVAQQANDDARARGLVSGLVEGGASLYTAEAMLEAANRQVDLSSVQVSNTPQVTHTDTSFTSTTIGSITLTDSEADALGVGESIDSDLINLDLTQ